MVAAQGEPSGTAAPAGRAGRAGLAVLDGPTVRRWADAGLAALVAARTEIDLLNVYPVPDADTGTNLVRTMQAGVDALNAAGGAGSDSLAQVCDTLATALLRGACGNSGTILSQLLRGVADAARQTDALDGRALAAALSSAAGLARAALARPVEGTILSVADAAAQAATRAAAAEGDLGSVVGAARSAGEAALRATPGQLAALHGRVDAGGRGLVVLLAALESAVTGESTGDGRPSPTATDRSQADAPSGTGLPGPDRPAEGRADSPAHEVMYLLDTAPGPEESGRVAGLRAVLDRLGDSVVVVGGNGLWQVHAHVDDVGAAVEAGFAVGRPHRVRIVGFAPPVPRTAGTEGTEGTGAGRPGETAGLGLLAVVDGPGLTDLLARAGARVVPSEHVQAGLATAAQDAGTALVAVLPGDADTLSVALAAAAQDARLRVVRCRSAVQVIAAVAVHEPSRDAERDLLEMSTAAAGCRHGLVEVAEGEGMTSAGLCRAGDVLGHVDGDVAVIGSELAEVAVAVVHRLLGGGGELVTLVAGARAETGFADRVARAVRAERPDVDVTAYDGGQRAPYLLVGVE
ncbi:MAG: DAK2 domain-containing protein [Actinomycetales bacterium]